MLIPSFVAVSKVRDWLLHAQKHGDHGKSCLPSVSPSRFHSLLLWLQPVLSDHGLLTTVAYKLGTDQPACYALEVCEGIVC